MPTINELNQADQVKCGLCCFFKPDKNQRGQRDTGECHRLPPAIAVSITEIKFMHPLVSSENFCGEFRRDFNIPKN